MEFYMSLACLQAGKVEQQIVKDFLEKTKPNN